MSGPAQEIALARWLAAGLRSIGQISIEARDDGTFALTHREDTSQNDLVPYAHPDDAARLARFDDSRNYRPLKTAPTLQQEACNLLVAAARTIVKSETGTPAAP